MNNSITSLLSSYDKTTNRTRTIFSTLNIASIILLISFFNFRFSWKNNESGSNTKRINVYELRENHLDKSTLLYEFVEEYQVGVDKCKLIFAINKFYNYNYKDYCGDTSKFKSIAPVNNNTASAEEFSILTIPIIGIKIYIQDIPLLGGFAVAILLTWYYYARRREKSIVKIISNKLEPKTKRGGEEEEEKEEENKIQASIGISFSTIFSSIKNIDEENDTLFRNKKFSERILRYLFYAPTILLFFILLWDTVESYISGPDSQTYLEIVAADDAPVYLKSSGIDYYVSNFNLSRKDLENNSKGKFHSNVCTFHYTDIMFPGKCNWEIKLQMIIMTILSYLVLFYCWSLSSKIRKFRDDERPYLDKIYSHIN